MSETIVYVPGRIKSAVKGGHTTGVEDIYDDELSKTQKEINAEQEGSIAAEVERASGVEEFLQSEINGFNSQNYVSVDSYSDLPELGSVDTIYRVGSWDGTQIDATKYAEYAWKNTGIDQGEYVLLSVKTQVGEVFDISAYHATGGTLATYADLSAALDSNNGGGVPQSLQKGGMSIKYVQSSDNKYVQYFLPKNDWSIDPNDWEKINNVSVSQNTSTLDSLYAGNTEIGRFVSDWQFGQGIFNYYNYSSIDANHRIRISDGQVVSASGCKTYRFNNIPSYLKKIRILADLDDASYAIGFYSSNSDANFISGVGGVSRGMKIYESDIPNGTVLICVTQATSIYSDAIILFDDGGYNPKSLSGELVNNFGNSKYKYVDQDTTTKYLLDSIISEVSGTSITINTSKYEIVRGVFNASGVIQSDSTRIVNREYIDIRGFAYFSLTPASNCKFNIAYYNEPNDASFIAIESASWISVGGEYRTKGNYMRIQVMDNVTSPTPMTRLNDFAILGYSRIIKHNDYLAKYPKSNYSGDFYPDSYEFVQGTLTNGELSANGSYITSKDFIDISGLRTIKIVHDSGYKSAYALYNDDKTYVLATPMITSSSYEFDVSGYKYIKIVVGKIDGTQIRDASTHIAICGIKEHQKNSIDVSRLFVQGAIVNGAISPAGSRISSKQFIDIRNIDSISVSVNANYYYAICYYSSKDDSSYLGGLQWTNIGASYDVHHYNYMRITIRRADNADLPATDGNKVNVIGYQKNISVNNREYEGQRISLKNKMCYNTIWDKFTMFHSSSYDYDTVTQQGCAIYDGMLFMLRHHAIVEVVNLKTMEFVNEFEIEDIVDAKPHCNSGSFSKQFPEGNTSYPFLYTGRCSYKSDVPEASDAEINACYVLNITTAGATLAQTITFANDNHEYWASDSGGAWDWFVDKERNLLCSIGYAGTIAERKYLIKEFELPDANDGGTIALTDADVISQWYIVDSYNGINHAFQGCTVYGNYLIIPISRGDSGIESEAIRIFNKYNHQEIASFPLVEAEVGECQSVAVWNSLLYLASKNGRLDTIDFDASI